MSDVVCYTEHSYSYTCVSFVLSSDPDRSPMSDVRFVDGHDVRVRHPFTCERSVCRDVLVRRRLLYCGRGACSARSVKYRCCHFGVHTNYDI